MSTESPENNKSYLKRSLQLYHQFPKLKSLLNASREESMTKAESDHLKTAQNQLDYSKGEIRRLILNDTSCYIDEKDNFKVLDANVSKIISNY